MNEDKDNIALLWLCVTVLIATMAITRCSESTSRITVNITKGGEFDVSQPR